MLFETTTGFSFIKDDFKRLCFFKAFLLLIWKFLYYLIKLFKF